VTASTSTAKVTSQVRDIALVKTEDMNSKNVPVDGNWLCEKLLTLYQQLKPACEKGDSKEMKFTASQC